MAQSQMWSSRNTSRASIGASETEALKARAEQEKQLRDLERKERIDGLNDYKDKFKQVNKYLAGDLRDNFGSAISDAAAGLHSTLSKHLDGTINSYVDNYQISYINGSILNNDTFITLEDDEIILQANLFDNLFKTNSKEERDNVGQLWLCKCQTCGRRIDFPASYYNSDAYALICPYCHKDNELATDREMF